jgi:channel protein (hemolysin III family)
MYYGERFNGYSHLAGTLIAAAGAATLVTIAASCGGAARIVGVSVYGAALVLLYLTERLPAARPPGDQADDGGYNEDHEFFGYRVPI